MLETMLIDVPKSLGDYSIARDMINMDPNLKSEFEKVRTAIQ
jgi:hypothetical protein